MSHEAQKRFMDAAAAYVELHDRIKAASKEQRVMRLKMKELGDVILQYMKANDIPECDMAGERLVRKHTTRLGGIKRDYVEQVLGGVVDPDRVEHLLLQIETLRPVAEKEVLSRQRK